MNLSRAPDTAQREHRNAVLKAAMKAHSGDDLRGRRSIGSHTQREQQGDHLQWWPNRHSGGYRRFLRQMMATRPCRHRIGGSKTSALTLLAD